MYGFIDGKSCKRCNHCAKVVEIEGERVIDGPIMHSNQSVRNVEAIFCSMKCAEEWDMPPWRCKDCILKGEFPCLHQDRRGNPATDRYDEKEPEGST